MTDTLSSAATATRDDVAPLAARVNELSGEGALDVFRRAMELEHAGRSIVHLELGAPDVDAPSHVVDAAVAALRAGDARYVAPQGLPELREAIAADVRSRGIAASADQVIVTPSAKTAVFYAMLATVEPGSEVLVPDPGFPIYPSMARFAGGVPVGYALDADNAPDVDDIAMRIGPRTRVLCLNSPNNPTGGALDAADMARLAELVERHDLRVVTDDIYSRLVFDGGRAPSIAAFDGARSRTMLVDGFSKTYAMTGYRLGYLVVPRPWVERLVTMSVNGHTCVPPFIQRAGIAALIGPQDIVATQVAAYRARRDLLVRGLNALPGVKCPIPAGAFYVFPDFSALLAAHGLTSRAFADRLLEDHGVAAIDGAAFGSRGEGCVRLSFASAQADLDAAVTRIGEAVAGLAG
ncbi:MAG TPA: pyridoxal phosphate-dependent aminotransferase [Gemmatimonadaceae bacterium]|nr:pyridoxal phosphate-dependent aminotransferase [Gemmatimonadaceae bacterium]